MANKVQHNRAATRSPDVEGQATPAVQDKRQSDEGRGTPVRENLTTQGQVNDPAVPAPLDKSGAADEIAAPGEALAGENVVKVRATGAFLVYDPATLDAVGEEGGEMRLTAFVREKIDEGKLEEF